VAVRIGRPLFFNYGRVAGVIQMLNCINPILNFQAKSSYLVIAAKHILLFKTIVQTNESTERNGLFRYHRETPLRLSLGM
jgi:hypothetical protein